MDEYIDLVTKEGLPTGRSALKSEAHKHGWYHNTIHLWLYTRQGEILLQQRSHKKQIHPLLWDVSVAGHIDAGETFEQAATREAFEEIGVKLNPQDLLHIGSELFMGEYENGRIKDYEFHQIYISELKVPIELLEIDKQEVEAIKLVDFASFKHLIETSATSGHFIATNKPYYLRILAHIKNQLP